jgi:hypothetical protein
MFSFCRAVYRQNKVYKLDYTNKTNGETHEPSRVANGINHYSCNNNSGGGNRHNRVADEAVHIVGERDNTRVKQIK